MLEWGGRVRGLKMTTQRSTAPRAEEKACETISPHPEAPSPREGLEESRPLLAQGHLRLKVNQPRVSPSPCSQFVLHCITDRPEAPMTKPTLSDPITLRIPADVLADIETIARATERSRSWVMVRALKAYLQQEGADILAYQQGLAEVAAGDVEDLDEVLKDLQRIASDKVA